MKMKTKSFIGKVVLITLGMGLTILFFTGHLPNATVGDIWESIGLAYGIGFGFIDFNISRDNWVEKKKKEQDS